MALYKFRIIIIIIIRCRSECA